MVEYLVPWDPASQEVLPWSSEEPLLGPAQRPIRSPAKSPRWRSVKMNLRPRSNAYEVANDSRGRSSATNSNLRLLVAKTNANRTHAPYGRSRRNSWRVASTLYLK